MLGSFLFVIDIVWLAFSLILFYFRAGRRRFGCGMMVSNVRFPKPGFKIDAVAAVLIILTLIMEKSYQGIAPLLLLIAIVVYVLGWPIYLWKNK